MSRRSLVRVVWDRAKAKNQEKETKLWHDQEEWVTCQQYSILIFQYKSLVHLKCYILFQTPSQSDIWLQRYEQFFTFKNNVKHKNLSPLLGCRARGTAGLRGLEHPHFFAVIMFQIRVVKEMWRKINVTKRRSKGKWDEGHEREREWSKYQKNTLKGKGDSAYRPIDFYFKL